ncbi:YDG/SRA domain-containing protein [Kitasatospora kifunensis]|uniref:Transcriptional regulator with XRE-family HTH domain n=1 Tax=Kitasatospora kifunensis TaxID=58351 RepID=A0A7W7R0P0_KITKI|nr:YDG/SRA domain-containing protein [Kitasatospora kifunensis]MBB4923214.1 transcriptional regulator with XRE-family HTH domain [Kitasatospora kifunensis]
MAVMRGASRTAVYAALSGTRLPSAKNLDIIVDAWIGGGDVERQRWRDRRREVEEALAEESRLRGVPAVRRTAEEEDFTRQLVAAWGHCGSPSTEQVARHCDLSARTLDSYLNGRTIPTEERLVELFSGLLSAWPDDPSWISSTCDSLVGEALFVARSARKEEKARVKGLALALPGGQNGARQEFHDRIGEIPGVQIGQLFESRVALARAGVHRQMQGSITGTSQRGAESILLSGDDAAEDYGDSIIFTGQGGRSATTGQLGRDQQLAKGNSSLAVSAASRAPVRVVRTIAAGAGGRFRYDGLYRVEDYWSESDDGGHRVWRYRIARIPGANEGKPAALEDAEALTEKAYPEFGGDGFSVRRSRFVGMSAVTEDLKKLHDHMCQVCGVRIVGPQGPYVQIAHIRPIGDGGRSGRGNMLCLCPNHHIMLDLGVLIINPDLTIVSRVDSALIGRLREVPKHIIDRQSLADHRVRHGLPRRSPTYE